MGVSLYPPARRCAVFAYGTLFAHGKSAGDAAESADRGIEGLALDHVPQIVSRKTRLYSVISTVLLGSSCIGSFGVGVHGRVGGSTEVIG